MKREIEVFILTYCRRPEAFYGTELIFKTLRVGFPNARVHVVDNASIPEARDAITALARRSGCSLELLSAPGVEHGTFIERMLSELAARPTGADTAVFLDTDVCLWRDCESMEFERLLAGMLLEAYNDDVMQCVTMPRLHSSFLWISGVRELVGRIGALRRQHFDFRPFTSFSVKVGDVWLRYDTGAALYAALPDACQPFGECHMEYYDHIFAGSHFDLWQGKHPGELRVLMEQAHQWARKGDLDSIRGLWRRQGELWRRFVTPFQVLAIDADGRDGNAR